MIPKHPRIAGGLAVVAFLATAFFLSTLPSAKAQATYAAVTLPSPSVFVRWGNDTAPPGTRLIYSGFAYGSQYSQSGNNAPLVLQAGDAGSSAYSGNLLYPLETGSSGTTPPGIPTRREIVAAVCEAPNPTTVIWGTHTAPAGWVVLYKGYAMGSHYTQHGAVGPICVDSDAFDASHASAGNGSIVYATRLQLPASGSGDPPGGHVKCAVIMKL